MARGPLAHIYSWHSSDARKRIKIPLSPVRSVLSVRIRDPRGLQTTFLLPGARFKTSRRWTWSDRPNTVTTLRRLFVTMTNLQATAVISKSQCAYSRLALEIEGRLNSFF